MATDKLIAQIARKGGGKLLNVAIDTLLPTKAATISGRKRSLLGGALGAIAVRIATRSVPGAIVVGGGLLAKRLYERRRNAVPPADSATGKPAPKA